MRDTTALVSLIGPIILGVGIIGKWYVDGYRLGENEKRIEELTKRFETVRDRLHDLEVKLAERTRGAIRREGYR